MADFIPTQDAQFEQMAKAFAAKVARNPATYMVSPSDAQMITSVVQAFTDAMASASRPGTRTSSAISLKNETRNSARNVIRLFASQFRANMGISNEDLAELKVHRRPQSLGHRACPITSPQLAFIATTPTVDTLRFRDAIITNGKTRKKPYGAERLELFVAYLDGVTWNSAQPPDDAKYLRSYRKNPINVQHDPKYRGRAATYWGRWAGHNDDVGPWSLPVTLWPEEAAANETMKIKTKGGLKNDAPPLRIEGETDEEPRKKAA